jgi:hypothetical protein
VGASELETLKAALVNNHRFTEWCTIAALIGLVVEYAILLWLKKADLTRFEAALTVMAGIAIAGGVYGEYHVGSKASDAALRLQELSDRELALLRVEAARLTSENLNLRIAIADRDLTADQQNKIHEACRPFSGETVSIRSYPNDPEAARLIVTIKAALEPLIHVGDRTGQLLATWDTATPVLGIRLLPAQKKRPFAEAFVTMLKEQGNLSVEPLSYWKRASPSRRS